MKALKLCKNCSLFKPIVTSSDCFRFKFVSPSRFIVST
uniref:Aminophospholipid ATPase n=1 Tax=Arundo donax TaxID=35708 RepID=A0A0A9DJC2_ARUDO